MLCFLSFVVCFWPLFYYGFEKFIDLFDLDFYLCAVLPQQPSLCDDGMVAHLLEHWFVELAISWSLPHNNLGQVIHTFVSLSLSPSSVILGWP